MDFAIDLFLSALFVFILSGIGIKYAPKDFWPDSLTGIWQCFLIFSTFGSCAGMIISVFLMIWTL